MEALVYSRNIVDSDNIELFAWKLMDRGDTSFPGGTIIAGEKFTI